MLLYHNPVRKLLIKTGHLDICNGSRSRYGGRWLFSGLCGFAAHNPSRRKVGESLLDSCYDRVEAEVNGCYDRALVLIGTSDTWNDIMGKSVTNLMLLTPEPFFLNSWMSDEWQKTPTNEAEKLISWLKPFEKRLVSFISDTKNKMKAVHKELY